MKQHLLMQNCETPVEVTIADHRVAVWRPYRLLPPHKLKKKESVVFRGKMAEQKGGWVATAPQFT